MRERMTEKEREGEGELKEFIIEMSAPPPPPRRVIFSEKADFQPVWRPI